MGGFRITATPPTVHGHHAKRAFVNPADSLVGQVLRAAEQPGPGQYGNLALAPPKGGRIGRSNAKSGLEWELYRSAQIPAPNEYPAPKLPEAGGGRFSTSKAPTDLEIEIARAKEMPGPLDYGPVATRAYMPRVHGDSAPKNFSGGPQRQPIWVNGVPGPGQYKSEGVGAMGAGVGGKFNIATAKSDLEWTIHYAKQRPGPDAYDAPMTDRHGHSVRCAVVSGGQWNRAASKSGLEWTIHRAAQVPSVNDYDILSSKDYLDGRSGPGPRKGAVMVGKGGMRLTSQRFAELRSNTEPPRAKPGSASHEATLTPWRTTKSVPTATTKLYPSGVLQSDGQLPRTPGTAPPRSAVGSRGTSRGDEFGTDRLANLFAEVDSQNTGELNTDGVFALCKKLGKKVRGKELAKAFRDMDTDCSGTVDIEEFRVWWTKLNGLEVDASKPAPEPEPEPQAAAPREQAKSVEYVKHAKAMIRKLLILADADMDGRLSYEEFRALQGRCGRDAATLTRDKWIDMCESYEADPFKGLDFGALFKMYANSDARGLDRLTPDCCAMSAGLPDSLRPFFDGGQYSASDFERAAITIASMEQLAAEEAYSAAGAGLGSDGGSGDAEGEGEDAEAAEGAARAKTRLRLEGELQRVAAVARERHRAEQADAKAGLLSAAARRRELPIASGRRKAHPPTVRRLTNTARPRCVNHRFCAPAVDARRLCHPGVHIHAGLEKGRR